MTLGNEQECESIGENGNIHMQAVNNNYKLLIIALLYIHVIRYTLSYCLYYKCTGMSQVSAQLAGPVWACGAVRIGPTPFPNRRS